MTAELCADCGTPLTDRYCSHCGQKRFDDRDHRVVTLVADFFEDFSRFDSRLWQSIVALFFRPGLLGRAWLEGKRTRYVKPVTLFLIANFLYFLAPVIAEFNLPLEQQMNQPLAPITLPWVEHRIAARAAEHPPYTWNDYSRAYDAKSESISKGLVILHVPFLALALVLLFWNRRLYYAEHVAVALNLFTFVLLSLQIVITPIIFGLARLDVNFGRTANDLAIGALFLGYFVIALRRTYACGWVYAAIAAITAFVTLLAVTGFVYRPVQFLLTFALT